MPRPVPAGIEAFGLQVIGMHSRAKQERHLHGAVPLALSAISMAMLALVLTVVPWLAFCCIVLAMCGLVAIEGPAWSWPAAWLQQEDAVMGMSGALCAVQVAACRALIVLVLQRQA